MGAVAYDELAGAKWVFFQQCLGNSAQNAVLETSAQNLYINLKHLLAVRLLCVKLSKMGWCPTPTFSSADFLSGKIPPASAGMSFQQRQEKGEKWTFSIWGSFTV